MGLKARDASLPENRRELRRKIEEDFLNDENVIGLFYGGSIGSNQTDHYSDIDVRVVVKDEQYVEVLKYKKERAESWGDVLFFEQVSPSSTYMVVHYRTFIKVDCFYYRANDLKPSVWLKDMKIIHDPTRMLTGIKNRSLKMCYEVSAEDFQVWSTKLFAYFHEAYRRSIRKERSYAQSMILGLKWIIASGWHMENNIQPNSFGDWLKMEGKRSQLPPEQQKLLKSWPVEGGLESLEIMAPEAKRVYQSLCKKLNLTEEFYLIDEVFDLVFEKEGI